MKIQEKYYQIQVQNDVFYVKYDEVTDQYVGKATDNLTGRQFVFAAPTERQVRIKMVNWVYFEGSK